MKKFHFIELTDSQSDATILIMIYENLGVYGAWDTNDVTTVQINEKSAVCMSER